MLHDTGWSSGSGDVEKSAGAKVVLWGSYIRLSR